MERLSIDKFTRFQTEKVTQTPAPKCRLPQYTHETCMPMRASESCHKCAVEWKENKDV